VAINADMALAPVRNHVRELHCPGTGSIVHSHAHVVNLVANGLGLEMRDFSWITIHAVDHGRVSKNLGDTARLFLGIQEAAGSEVDNWLRHGAFRGPSEYSHANMQHVALWVNRWRLTTLPAFSTFFLALYKGCIGVQAGLFTGCAFVSHRSLVHALTTTKMMLSLAWTLRRKGLLIFCPFLAQNTVRVSKLLLTKCVQAHDDYLKVLPHINLYLLTRQPRTIRSPGHVNSQFFKFRYFQEFCLARPRHFFQKSTKNH